MIIVFVVWLCYYRQYAPVVELVDTGVFQRASKKSSIGTSRDLLKASEATHAGSIPARRTNRTLL